MLQCNSSVLIILIWIVSTICDRIWYYLDNSAPAWDSADYLNGALNYWHALQTPQLLDIEWWQSFWLLSNKIPPLHYILTAPFFSWFGLRIDSASLIMSLYSGILLVAVYSLGKNLFNRRIAIIAAILCQVLPGLYYYRLKFLLDFPLTAVTVASFALLTVWKLKQKPSWLWAILFGISLGLAMLLKQTALFFLFFPLLWLSLGYLKNHSWLRIAQLIGSISIAIAICFPWYRTNWLLILTSSKRATIDSAIIEGDPALNTLDAWLYYWKTLPYLVSWHLLLIPIVGYLLYAIAKYFKFNFYSIKTLPIEGSNNIRWLLVYLLGGYLLSSLNINKDARYILPLLPIFTLFIGLGLELYKNSWRTYIQRITITLAIVLMLLNIYPLPGSNIAEVLAPRTQTYPYLGTAYPHKEVVREIIQTEPYLRHTLGVLPSTPAINQHNFSFYGGLQKFQVVGRQVGIREEEVMQDARSLEWFITKTGDQGSVPEAEATINKLVTEGGNFNLQKSWQLPDSNQLNLYRSKEPSVTVKEVERAKNKNSTVKLNSLTLPAQTAPGNIIPVTYKWLGDREQLANGIVLLSWVSVAGNPDNKWISDRAIGMGMLVNNSPDLERDKSILEVTENTAISIPQNTKLGKYKLQITYLNRQTNQSYPISTDNVIIAVENNAQSLPAPELDLVTQLRTIAPTMGTGITALEPIFAQTARINQYDGKQDYLQQTEIALSYRLKKDNPTLQQKLEWSYAIALSQVLQQDVKGAITTWNEITKLDPKNPYNYAYLAFVYLYNWQPKLANIALNKAEAIEPNIPEVKTLKGVAAIMQGNLLKAWRLLMVNG